jgi:hypothetical protein
MTLRATRRDEISPQTEQRLFSKITLKMCGRPLTSHQVIVDLIANTHEQQTCPYQAPNLQNQVRPRTLSCVFGDYVIFSTPFPSRAATSRCVRL